MDTVDPNDLPKAGSLETQATDEESSSAVPKSPKMIESATNNLHEETLETPDELKAVEELEPDMAIDVSDTESVSSGEEDSETRVSAFSFGELPMPDSTGFEVPLPPGLQPDLQPSTDSEALPPSALAPPPKVVHVSQLLKPLDLDEHGPSFEGVKIAHLGREAGLSGDMQATYMCLPPGTRTSRPVAQRLGDSITYCISGCGLLWQNGWTFPFEATDAAGWKGGTGIAHTIINDSNRDGGPGEDLILITAYEVRQDESVFYPLNPEIDESALRQEGKSLWKDPPVQGEFGRHPALASVSPERGNKEIPDPQRGYRPSNSINSIAELDTIGEGELFANATSLSQETGLSGRFGCNFEVPPPGTRSSDPHAHSLEDELVYIVSGSGFVWLNGHVEPVHEGDAVGFPAGTGIAHNFINDSNAGGAEGEPLILWIIGQNKIKEGDLVYYPLHTERKNTSKRWWADCPKYELGPHNGRPERGLGLLAVATRKKTQLYH